MLNKNCLLLLLLLFMCIWMSFVFFRPSPFSTVFALAIYIDLCNGSPAQTNALFQKIKIRFRSSLYLARKAASCLSRCENKAIAVPLCMMTFWYKPLASGDSINRATLAPPADSPNMVTLSGLPPNLISCKR